MDPKIGVYICKGCEIGRSLDIDQLIKEAEAGKHPVCKTHDCLPAPIVSSRNCSISARMS